MRRLMGLGVVVAFMLLSVATHGGEVVFPRAQATLSFGFLLLAAYLVGDTLSRIGLPRITGYILAGIAFGPHVLDIVAADTVAELKLIDDLALTFIALAAGGELRLAELRKRRRAILTTVALLTGLVFVGVTVTVTLARPLLPFLDGKPLIHVVAVAAIVGTFAVARSPSSAIAIISECKARGPFTEMVLGVTVVMDVLVIMLFAVVVSLCEVLVAPGAAMDLGLLMMMTAEIVGAIALGVGLGWGIALYIRRVRADLLIFILGVAFLVTFGSRQGAVLLERWTGIHLQLEPMLICITAGFVVQNFSREGERFIAKIDRGSLPIYVLFFALTGAALQIQALRATWLLALVIVVVRVVLIWVAGHLGARLAKDPPQYWNKSGLSFVTQAGVSLGLASIVMARFPEWGAKLATTIVAVITINQVIGPPGFKHALVAVGEAGAPRSTGAESGGQSSKAPNPAGRS